MRWRVFCYSPRYRPMTNVFLSYRRDDAGGHAGRLCDRLIARFGAARVFMDVQDIEPGQNFEQAIEQTLAKCDVMAVVVGPRWVDIMAARAESGEDFVRHEIAIALHRQMTVIPVVMGGARMPSREQLPSELSAFGRCQAVGIRDDHFDEDAARLVSFLAGPAEPSGVSILGARLSTRAAAASGCDAGSRSPGRVADLAVARAARSARESGGGGSRGARSQLRRRLDCGTEEARSTPLPHSFHARARRRRGHWRRELPNRRGTDPRRTLLGRHAHVSHVSRPAVRVHACHDPHPGPPGWRSHQTDDVRRQRRGNRRGAPFPLTAGFELRHLDPPQSPRRSAEGLEQTRCSSSPLRKKRRMA